MNKGKEGNKRKIAHRKWEEVKKIKSREGERKKKERSN